MNVITKEELQLIEQLKEQYKKNYQEYKEYVDEENKRVDEYLEQHDGKKHEVKRTSYIQDRWNTLFNKNKDKNRNQKNLHKKLSDRAKEQQETYNERKEESKGEHLSSDISVWVSGQYSQIHVNESHVDELDPKNKELNNKDFEINHNSMLKKIALYSAAKEENSKRSFWSKLFNWKKDLQNYFSTRRIRKSIQEENGMKKKEFKKVYKFVKNTDEKKFDKVHAFDENANKIVIEDELFETSENYMDKVFEVGKDKVNEKDRILNQINKNEDNEIEIEAENENDLTIY